MPNVPIPNSQGMPQPDNAGPAGAKAAKMAPPAGGGEIAISRAEATALTVFETEDDEAEAYQKAEEESGLSKSQIERLKARADAARGKGFTLRGGSIVLKPKEGGADERGLVWHNPKEKAEEEAKTKAEKNGKTAHAKAAPAKAAKAASGGDSAEDTIDLVVDEVKRRAMEKIKKDLEA